MLCVAEAQKARQSCLLFYSILKLFQSLEKCERTPFLTTSQLKTMMIVMYFSYTFHTSPNTILTPYTNYTKIVHTDGFTDMLLERVKLLFVFM